MTRTILTLTVLAAAVSPVAGCGSSSSPGVAHLASGTSSSADPGSGASSSPESEGNAAAQQKVVAFSHCMRSHGVPEFPEPSEGHVLIRRSDHNGHVTGVNPQSAQFQAAMKDCAKLSPKGGKPPSPAEQAKLQEQALEFSQCMRTHGVPASPIRNSPVAAVSEYESGGVRAVRAGSIPTRPSSRPPRKRASRSCPGRSAGREA